MRADARRSRGRLLETARAMFVSEGVDVSFNEIARRAGVGPATLYRHFPQREDLIAAVVGTSLDEVTALATTLDTAPDPGAALWQWIASLVAHIRRVRGLSDEIMRALEFPDSPLAPHCAAAMAAAGAVLARAQQSGRANPDATTEDIVKIASAIAWASGQTDTTDPAGDRLLNLVLHGIISPDKARPSHA
ncbi:TetR/AcrR family transcriptional regulator [Nocardia brevicatena]|uniref:TetR/AcrR family transcriptional regulator n=1 Tax=Nocardia brevicatena TaxID=37327 RepID=UPI000594865D|nr:TetR/AcrR family transcriptional regulator [Nocardia brevicatena]